MIYEIKNSKKIPMLNVSTHLNRCFVPGKFNSIQNFCIFLINL